MIFHSNFDLLGSFFIRLVNSVFVLPIDCRILRFVTLYPLTSVACDNPPPLCSAVRRPMFLHCALLFGGQNSSTLLCRSDSNIPPLCSAVRRTIFLQGQHAPCFEVDTLASASLMMETPVLSCRPKLCAILTSSVVDFV